MFFHYTEVAAILFHKPCNPDKIVSSVKNLILDHYIDAVQCNFVFNTSKTQQMRHINIEEPG